MLTAHGQFVLLLLLLLVTLVQNMFYKCRSKSAKQSQSTPHSVYVRAENETNHFGPHNFQTTFSRADSYIITEPWAKRPLRIIVSLSVNIRIEERPVEPIFTAK